MTELISRQAALYEIDKNRETLLSSGMKGAEHILVHYGRRVIEELPTIEPKYAGWISCKKKMPKPNEVVGDVAKYYLVQTEYGDMMVACYNAEGDARWWEQMYQYGAIMDEIVAWMELPDEYKEGGEDEHTD